MSLAIDVNKIDMVLLVDGWHEVANASFDLDAYEYAHEDRTLLEGGSTPSLPTTGATWRELDGNIVACPITTVLAVKWNTRPRSEAVESSSYSAAIA
jgi:hypothetical protein